MAYDGKTYTGKNTKSVVYVWTENGVPCYVGYTANKIHRRIMGHKTKRSSCRLLSVAMNGRLNEFRCYVICEAPADKLPELEAKYIKHYNTFNDWNTKGYNMTTGGKHHYEVCKATRNLQVKAHNLVKIIYV